MNNKTQATKPTLEVNLGGIRMKNPVMVASGTFGYGQEYADLVDLNRLGAIVVKGISLEPTRGNPPPRTVEVASGLINAIGLQNPGAEFFIREYLPFLRRYDVPVIVNIWGRTMEEYAEVASKFDQVDGVSGLEINLSCPNIKAGSRIFSGDLDMFQRTIAAVRARTRLPLIPKLAPDVSDIAAYARGAENCGANAISLINSFPAMSVDVESRKPRLANMTGGLTGPAIRPIAVRLVWLAAQAVKIPVIGMGGIASADDALEFFMAGASAVAVGTATFTHPDTALRVVDGLEKYLMDNKMDHVGQLVGSLQS